MENCATVETDKQQSISDTQHQEPTTTELTETPNNLQLAIYNQPDNQEQTTTTDRDTLQSTVGTLQPTRQQTTNKYRQLTIQNNTPSSTANNRQVIKTDENAA